MKNERTIEFLRTPEERFIGMVNFGFKSNYITLGGARIHYIDEGQGETVLLLHGEPSWSFGYRRAIWDLRKNYRVLAPDMVGFGKSDKLPRVKDYSFRLHLRTAQRFVEKLELAEITLVVHDWGGLIGLAMLGQDPARFKRIVIMNTGLPTGDRKLSLGFRLWQLFAKWSPWFPVGAIVNAGCRKPLLKDVRMAYDAPFVDNRHKAGARAWPLLVPTEYDAPGAEEMRQAKEVLSTWNRPALVLFSDSDPFFKDGGQFFRKLIPTASHQPEVVIKRAGHFLFEDKPEEVTAQIRAFLERTA